MGHTLIEGLDDYGESLGVRSNECGEIAYGLYVHELISIRDLQGQEQRV